MKANIRALIQLQDCDNQIQTMTTRKTEAPLKIHRLEEELTNFEKKFQENNDRFENLKKDRRSLEQEVQDLENKIEKSNDKLSHIKSNKEYTAALKEIEDLKNAISLKEDSVLQCMEELEEVEKICRANKDQQKEMSREVDEKKKDIQNELEILEKELGNLENERIQFTQEIDQELLKRYLFLKERKGGRAISSVVGGVCLACNMGIPPQQFNELQKKDSLLNCPYCHRMIYFEEKKSED